MNWFRVVDTFVNPEHVEQMTYDASTEKLTLFFRGQPESFLSVVDPDSIREIFEQVGQVEWLKSQIEKECKK